MMAQLRVDFQGRREVQPFSRARVEAMRDGVPLTLRVPRQVRALRPVLAQQPVGVFVGAALPGAIRIGEEDLDGEPLGQRLVLGHRFPPIIGQGFAQQGGHVPECLGDALSGTRRIRPLHPGQEDQAGRPLHPGADGRAIAGPLDEVAFPVAGHRAGGPLGGALGNRRHIGDLAASIRPSRPRPTRLARLTQRRQQFAPQGSAGQHIEPHLDRLGRELFPHVVRIRALETSGTLLGRAALGPLRPHVLPQPGIQEFAGSPWLTGSGGRLDLRRTGAIGAAPRAVASRLAAHGAGGASQHPRPRPERMAVGQAQAQGLTFFRTHVCVGSRSHDNTVAHQGL